MKITNTVTVEKWCVGHDYNINNLRYYFEINRTVFRLMKERPDQPWNITLPVVGTKEGKIYLNESFEYYLNEEQLLKVIYLLTEEVKGVRKSVSELIDEGAKIQVRKDAVSKNFKLEIEAALYKFEKDYNEI